VNVTAIKWKRAAAKYVKYYTEALKYATQNTQSFSLKTGMNLKLSAAMAAENIH